TTVAGDDVVLPCQLEPPVDAVQMTIEWGKPDLNPRFVFVRHNGQELQTDQNTAYKGRVSLTIDKLKHGDVSLKLSKVKVSDSGRYRCYIPQQSKEYFGELLVGKAPHIKINNSVSGVMLECKSAGWYPEPEVIWMDSDGNHLSAGPTETQRGPNDLYTVSSRVAVEKRHNNNFTCRCVTDGTFVTLVPALCRSFTRSPRVVLGSLLTVLMIILTPRDEILRGAPDRGRLSVVLYVFHFLMIAPTVDFFTPSCLPIVDSLFPVWCRSTILFLVSFESSLVLAMAEFGV
uniref:Ig-like domain-containing protein n=1 Tax=Maylandia zebra TaxID=106582 RepID=A0A3P9AUS7_9CICH